MSILFYTRPDYVTKHSGPLNASDCQKYVEKARCSKTAIPPNLSFDSIVEGKTRPPCSLQDFMDYLIYVSHDAENLQFYLWLQDYTKRFDVLPSLEKSLSPEWIVNDAPPDLCRTLTAKASENSRSTNVCLGKHLASRATTTELIVPHMANWPSDVFSTNMNSVSELSINSKGEADARRTRYDMQPFRSEVHQILAHYIYTNSPRELNISHRIRSSILLATQHTTHPSAFSSVVSALSLTLQNQSHPNFIRWAVCNGNKPRVFFLRSMVIMLLFLGILMATLLCLSGSSRWWRLFVWPIWMIAVTGIVATYQGLCIVLSKAHSRQAHPWELDETDSLRVGRMMSPSSTAIAWDCEAAPDHPDSMDYSSTKMHPFGDDNSYQHEQWIKQWTLRKWWRKVSVKRVWIQEEGLKGMQDRIVMQSQVWGAIITIPATVALVALPVGGIY